MVNDDATFEKALPTTMHSFSCFRVISYTSFANSADVVLPFPIVINSTIMVYIVFKKNIKNISIRKYMYVLVLISICKTMLGF